MTSTAPELVSNHALEPLELERASWGFANFVFGRGCGNVVSMNKAIELG
jgi:hypothetical protein